MAYSDELLNKKFIANAVIQIKGQYFCVRQPDSGLTVGADYRGTVLDLTLPETQVDLRQVTTTIAQYSFTLQDKNGVVSSLFNGDSHFLAGEVVNIWLGRTTGSFPFSQYFQLQQTRVKAVTYNGGKIYSFSVAEPTDRMNKSIFGLQSTLAGDILSGTTTISVQSTTDLSTWPTSGIWKIEDEFGTYAGVDNVAKQLTGCTRGLKGTTAVSHKAGSTVYNVVDVQDNPLNLLLQLLISVGGGGTYDVLSDGIGLDQSLVDIAGITALRDTYFNGDLFSFSMYNTGNALSFIQSQILAPCNLRLTTSQDGKVSVAILNISPLNLDPTLIDEHTITEPPVWSVDQNDVINQISIEWDWDEGTQTFKQITPYKDATSIAQYGALSVFTLQCKGIKASLGGQAFVDAFAARMLGRFKNPMPTIEVSTQMDKSLLTPGAKGIVASSKLPTMSGDYNFWAELEVLSRGINFFTGDVKFKMMFTLYSNVRQCFIAPTHTIVGVTNQHQLTLAAGGGAYYRVGWPMRIFDLINKVFTSDAPNIIQSIVGDVITFQNDFTTILSANNFRLTMPMYDETVQSQRGYCFIGVAGGGNFTNDNSPPYMITF